jgi:ribose-phosphate pyrophosphokinase
MELLFWVDAFKRASAMSVTVVMPYFSDAGFAKKARMFASHLGAPLAIADKVRADHDEHATVTDIIGEVAGRNAVLVDDFTISAGTLVEAAESLVARGARSVMAAVTHGVFAEGSTQRLDASPIRRLIVTDTVETQPTAPSGKVRVVSVAPLFAEAIRRIHHRESISGLSRTEPWPPGQR